MSFLSLLSKNSLIYLMKAIMLQKLLKASYNFSIVAKFRGILNDNFHVKKWLEASLPISVSAKCRDSISKKIVWFQT